MGQRKPFWTVSPWPARSPPLLAVPSPPASCVAATSAGSVLRVSGSDLALRAAPDKSLDLPESPVLLTPRQPLVSQATPASRDLPTSDLSPHPGRSSPGSGSGSTACVRMCLLGVGGRRHTASLPTVHAAPGRRQLFSSWARRLRPTVPWAPPLGPVLHTEST